MKELKLRYLRSVKQTYKGVDMINNNTLQILHVIAGHQLIA